MYAVTATVTRVSPRDGYTGTRSLPMFFLDPKVQGITSPEGAEVLAREIIAPYFRPEETVVVHVHEVLSEERAA